MRISGAIGDEIEAYAAAPVGGGTTGGVVVIHHMPGYDSATKEMVRRFATLGYAAVCPNLYWREAPGADPDDAAATARANGGVPDERLVGDVDGAARWLRERADSNGKVGVIGHCSGGRQAVLAACSLPLDAAVDCYGAFVTGQPPEGFPLKVVPLNDRLGSLSCPLLGLFGAEDSHPSPDQVAELDQLLKESARRTSSPPTRAPGTPSSPWIGRATGPPPRSTAGSASHRSSPPSCPAEQGGPSMCTYTTVQTPVTGSGKGPDGWFALRRATVYYDHPVHAQAEHTPNIDLADPSRGPGGRVAVELTAASALDLVDAIHAALAAVPPGLAEIDPREFPSIRSSVRRRALVERALVEEVDDGYARPRPPEVRQGLAGLGQPDGRGDQGGRVQHALLHVGEHRRVVPGGHPVTAHDLQLTADQRGGRQRRIGLVSEQQADLDVTAPAAQARHRGGKGGPATEGVQREVRATAGQLADRYRSVRAGGKRVRRPETSRSVPGALADINGDDLCPAGGRDLHGREPDPAAAVHRNPLAGLDVSQPDDGAVGGGEPAAQRGRRHRVDLVR